MVENSEKQNNIEAAQPFRCHFVDVELAVVDLRAEGAMRVAERFQIDAIDSHYFSAAALHFKS